MTDAAPPLAAYAIALRVYRKDQTEWVRVRDPGVHVVYPAQYVNGCRCKAATDALRRVFRLSASAAEAFAEEALFSLRPPEDRAPPQFQLSGPALRYEAWRTTDGWKVYQVAEWTPSPGAGPLELFQGNSDRAELYLTTGLIPAGAPIVLRKGLDRRSAYWLLRDTTTGATALLVLPIPFPDVFEVELAAPPEAGA